MEPPLWSSGDQKVAAPSPQEVAFPKDCSVQLDHSQVTKAKALEWWASPGGGHGHAPLTALPAGGVAWLDPEVNAWAVLKPRT